MNSQRAAVLIFVILSLNSCSGLFRRPPGAVGEVVTVVGEVRSVDTDPMAYDGPAAIELQTDAFGAVTAYVSACMGGCALEAVNQLAEVEVGELWQVTGEVQGDGSLALYRDGEHGLLGLSEK